MYNTFCHKKGTFKTQNGYVTRIMDSTALLEPLFRTETRDKCFQQGFVTSCSAITAGCP